MSRTDSRRRAAAPARLGAFALRDKWTEGEWFLTGAPDAPPDRILAVLFETTSDAGTATIVAADDGTASIYTSRGGGILGLGENPSVAEAARHLVAQARLHAHALPRVDECPLPPEGHVAFWALARSGARGTLLAEARVLEDDTTRALYIAAQDLITQMRLHAPAQ